MILRAGTWLVAVCAVALAACDQAPTDAAVLSGTELTASHKSIDGTQATSINGGGHILEGDRDISFAGEIVAAGSGTLSQISTVYSDGDGTWVIQFHNVSNPDVDGGKFEATGVMKMEFFDGDDPNSSCDAAMNMTLTGTFNGTPGWSVIFRAGDAGHTTDHDREDTARVQLFDASDMEVYDTFDSDFGGGSNCVGSARTDLDKGNLKIK